MVAPISVNSRQVERHDARAGALADRDRQLAVLHRRIEGLLERARQAVDLVDEEDAARLERGQVGGDVALALERRAGGLHERRPRARSRRSARARSCRGRAGRRAARGRAPRRAPRAASMNTASWSLTARWPTKSSSRCGRSERSSSSSAATRPRRPAMPLDARGADARRHRAALSAAAIRSSGVSPSAPSSSSSASCGLKPRPEQALARERARVVAGGAAHDDLVATPGRPPSRAARR